MTKSVITAAVGVLIGWYMAYDFSVYGTDDIYYVKGFHLGTESGRVDSTFTSMKEMSVFLDSISAQHGNEFFDNLERAIRDYTEVEITNGKVLVRVPHPAWADSMIVIRTNSIDTIDGGTLHYVID